jgi:hypothetical protein
MKIPGTSYTLFEKVKPVTPVEREAFNANNIVTFNLDENNYVKKSKFSVKGIKSGEEIERVQPDKLELVYRREPFISVAVNLYEEMIVASNYEVVAESEKVKEKAEALLDRIEFHYEVLPDIVKHLCVFGNSWNEVVWNEKGTDIVCLDTMDPKYMDFGRDKTTGNILFEPNGKPEFYVQYLRDNMVYKGPESDLTNQGGNRGLMFKRPEIMHTRLQRVGDCYSGIGLIEPVYNTVLNKVDIQTGLAQSMLRLGFPIIGAKVGNKEMYPTPQLVEEAAQIFKDIGESTGFAIPYYFEPILMEPKRSERVQTNLEYFTDQVIAGMGIPKSLITGAGEQENKQTLRELKTILRLRMKSMQRKIAHSIRDQVFRQQAEAEGWKEIPSLEFGDPAIEALTEQAERLAGYVHSGILETSPELQAMVKKAEGIKEAVKQ